MPKQSPVPDDFSKPFWDACNEERLILQNCKACDARRGLNALQYPPQPTCVRCGASDTLEWLEMVGRGNIREYCVMYDCRTRSLQADQPFNIACIELGGGPQRPDVLPFARHACGRCPHWGQGGAYIRGDPGHRPEGPRVAGGGAKATPCSSTLSFLRKAGI